MTDDNIRAAEVRNLSSPTLTGTFTPPLYDQLIQANARIAELEKERDQWQRCSEDMEMARGLINLEDGTVWNAGDVKRLRRDYEQLSKKLKGAVSLDIGAMVNRFLGWRLPDDFHPDCGISFKGEGDYNHPKWGRTKFEPTGTNLFDAIQAKMMFVYALGSPTPRLSQGGEMRIYFAPNSATCDTRIVQLQAQVAELDDANATLEKRAMLMQDYYECKMVLPQRLSKLEHERDALRAQLAERDKPCVWTLVPGLGFSMACRPQSPAMGAFAGPKCLWCGHPVEVREHP